MRGNQVHIYVDIATKANWERHAIACGMKLSQWISMMIHLGLSKDLDKAMQRVEPNRVVVTAAVDKQHPIFKGPASYTVDGQTFPAGSGPVPETAVEVQATEGSWWWVDRKSGCVWPKA